MPNIELLLAFTLATAVFAYMPGPSTLYAAAQTIARGRKGGLLAAAGIHTGGYVHVVASASGLVFLFKIFPLLYIALKVVGAAYLIWLGVRIIFSGVTVDEPTFDRINIKKNWSAFWESAIVEILNPKTAIFYVAFLPQFTDPAAELPLWGQLLVLGTIVNVAFSSADLICVFLAEKVSRFLRSSPSANRLANRIGGSILIGLGVNLGLNR